jgi:hypothetical protein
MIDHQSVSKWLQDYVAAWKSYERSAIEALFSVDAQYRFNPYDDPISGRSAIVADWLENQDEPGSFSADYKPIAVDGNTAVANGRSIYYEADGKTVEREFDNIFVLKFNDAGECAEFCDWYVEAR